jgi:hypothetical protein
MSISAELPPELAHLPYGPLSRGVAVNTYTVEPVRWMDAADISRMPPGLLKRAVDVAPNPESRPDIVYDVPPIRQRPSECMQTAAAMLLRWHDADISVDDVLAEVPVYVENGVKIGTAPGHIGAYACSRGYPATARIFDMQLFDRSWQHEQLSPQDVLARLRQRAPAIPHFYWQSKYSAPVLDGWEKFVAAGGTFSFEPLTTDLLYRCLQTGPFFAMLSSTVLNQEAKRRYDPSLGSKVPDDIAGDSSTHGVICSGYRGGNFLLTDPSPRAGQEPLREAAPDVLVEAISTAVIQSANLLLTVHPKQ